MKEDHMMSIGNGFLLFVFVIILLFPSYVFASRGISVRSVSPAGEEAKGDQWLFVVAVDTYIYLPCLGTLVNDAKAFRD